MSKCFAIFEGGGAKGLAHVGALKAAEARGLEFIGIAGASAGAIIAALVAAGYTADELYALEQKTAAAVPLFAGVNWTELLGGRSWNEFREFTKEAHELVDILSASGSPGLKAGFKVRSLWKKWSGQIQTAARRQGVFSTDKFERWLDQVLSSRFSLAQGVTFDDLYRAGRPTLKLVAVDIAAQKLVTYSYLDTPAMPIAKAVAASISIPFFFMPTMLDGKGMIDGGLMSNFPAWLFESERSLNDPFIRTYGFTLVDRENPTALADTLMDTVLAYVAKVARTAVFGGQTLLNDDVALFHVIPITTRFGVLDFELSSTEKDELFNEGLTSAREFFQRNGVVNDGFVSAALMELTNQLAGRIGRPSARFRASVIFPIKRDFLGVTYSYNMRDFNDDRLLLPKNHTGAGEALTKKDIVVTDLRQHRHPNGTIGGLDKYSSVLVPTDLISLISSPIFRSEKDWETAHPELRTSPRAVLVFDCNEDIIPLYNRKDIQDFVTQASVIIGRLLQGNLE